MPSVAPDQAEEQLIGSLVDGRYKVIEAMASGSMGAVYKAERVPVGKLVAIKFLHAAFARDTEFLSRFERETRVMSKLAHPNCVSVVDFGVFEGKPYLVMDYVTGSTLRSVIDIGPLEPPRALTIARQIAAGLAHAHAQGITHRDVKPANIMISEEIGTGEHVRILDFGLARLRGAVGRDATQSNVVVGTPNYMAPEQTIGGGIIDARTDVYAVGVVLFEMIVGERPFQAEDTLALLGMHRAAPIPKMVDRMHRDAEIPEGLQAIVEKAMAKAPDDRYQSAIELAEAIDRIARVGSVSGIRAAVEPRDPIIVAPSGKTRRSRTDDGMAPTLVDVTEPSVDEPFRKYKKKSAFWPAAFLVLLLLGLGAYAAWWLKGKITSDKPKTGSANVTAPVIDAAVGASDGDDDDDVTPPADAAPISVDAFVPVDAPTPIDAAEPVIAADAMETGSAAEPPPPIGPGSAGSAAGSGATVDPADPDPEKADHVAPKTNDDESATEETNAPKDEKEVEKRAPAPPVKGTLDDALALIRQGKTDSAIATLRVLKPKNARSAYIPFLLGNLYFDKRWWTLALREYATAIGIHGGYRSNGTLIRNTIRMMASPSTVGSARWLLQSKIGKPAIPALKYAATHSKNGTVKWNAGATLRAMGVR